MRNSHKDRWLSIADLFYLVFPRFTPWVCRSCKHRERSKPNNAPDYQPDTDDSLIIANIMCRHCGEMMFRDY